MLSVSTLSPTCIFLAKNNHILQSVSLSFCIFLLVAVFFLVNVCVCKGRRITAETDSLLQELLSQELPDAQVLEPTPGVPVEIQAP